MHIGSTVRSEHHAVVAEWVVRVLGQKDPVVPLRVHFPQVDPVAWLQIRIAAATGPAGATALEKHHQLVAGAGADEKPVETAVGAHRVTPGFDDVPARLKAVQVCLG